MDYLQRRRNIDELRALSQQKTTPKRNARMEALIQAVVNEELKEPPAARRPPAKPNMDVAMLILEEIKDRHFGAGESIQLDGKSFTGCTFDGCEVIYGGGETQFEKVNWHDCKVTLVGAANYTVQVLKALGCSIAPPSKTQPAAEKRHIRLRRDPWHPRGVRSSTGGVLADGPFYGKVEVFGSDLVYREGNHTLMLPVEFGSGGSCLVETDAIRRWDGTFDIFDKVQVATIARNVFAALDHLRIRHPNAN